MKKFLPLILFIVVFAGTLGGSILYKMLPDHQENKARQSDYEAYENLFLHANYETSDGSNLEISKLTSPVIIYNFWASWCIPCLEEMPSMINLKKRFRDDQLKIIAINTDEDDQKANIQKIIKKINLKDEFIIVPDKDSKLVNDFKISAIPVTIIFHRGKVVHFSNGPMDFNSEEIAGKISQWIKE